MKSIISLTITITISILGSSFCGSNDITPEKKVTSFESSVEDYLGGYRLLKIFRTIPVLGFALEDKESFTIPAWNGKKSRNATGQDKVMVYSKSNMAEAFGTYSEMVNIQAGASFHKIEQMIIEMKNIETIDLIGPFTPNKAVSPNDPILSRPFVVSMIKAEKILLSLVDSTGGQLNVSGDYLNFAGDASVSFERDFHYANIGRNVYFGFKVKKPTAQSKKSTLRDVKKELEANGPYIIIGALNVGGDLELSNQLADGIQALLSGLDARLIISNNIKEKIANSNDLLEKINLIKENVEGANSAIIATLQVPPKGRYVDYDVNYLKLEGNVTFEFINIKDQGLFHPTEYKNVHHIGKEIDSDKLLNELVKQAIIAFEN